MGKAPWKRAFEKGLERDVVIWWVEKERTFHAESGTSAKRHRVPSRPVMARQKICSFYILIGNFCNNKAKIGKLIFVFFPSVFLSRILGLLEKFLKMLTAKYFL